MWIALALACAAPRVSAHCSPDPADPTRASCAIALAESGGVEVTFSDGEEAVTFTADQGSKRHDLPIWGLHDGAWTWTVRAAGREITGGFLPSVLPEALQLEVGRTGHLAGVTHFVAPIDCDGGGFVTVLDALGRVRWFVDTGRSDVDMVHFTEESTVALVADKAAIVEVDLLGKRLLDRDDFELPVHHDLFRRGDRIYTLMADTYLERDGEAYVEDLVVALDRAGNEVWRWEEHGVFDATLANPDPGVFWAATFPGAIDAWHTNAIHPTADGDVLVSLKHEDAVFRVEGDTGALAWALVGYGSSPLFDSDFSLVDAAGDRETFAGQHHVALLPDGHLTVFDNSQARGLEIALDPSAGAAAVVGSWPLNLTCAIQSSVFPLDDGHRLLTCATGHAIAEFDETGNEVGRLDLTCKNEADLPRTTRGQPMDLWDNVSVGGVTASRLD